MKRQSKEWMIESLAAAVAVTFSAEAAAKFLAAVLHVFIPLPRLLRLVAREVTAKSARDASSQGSTLWRRWCVGCGVRRSLSARRTTADVSVACNNAAVPVEAILPRDRQLIWGAIMLVLLIVVVIIGGF
jgi:hypothetical protein